LSSALTTRATLTALLEEAQQRGFLGPGPVEVHIDVALDALPLLTPGVRAVDLGSGGGAVALPLMVLGPPVDWVLVEVSEARADFLRRAVGRLDRHDVTVLAEPAEAVGRRPNMRGSADVVVARSFGPPATTAECAAPLLRVGGRLAVTEPPDNAGDRWPAAGVAQLGLGVGRRFGAFQSLDQISACAERFPRRTGTPRRRPLF
jgi:16S rRNA (guanine527-N7)-methyltransferase